MAKSTWTIAVDQGGEPPRETRRLGNMSLVVVASGFIIMEVLTRSGLLNDRWWAVLTTAFEAGIIGALADWYAVTALFREVRIPLIRWRVPLLTEHSNILLRNREKITTNIATMVQDQWLSAEVIGSMLDNHPPAIEILKRYDSPSGVNSFLGGVKTFLTIMAKGLDQPEVVQFLDQIIRAGLHQLSPARPFGVWVKAAMVRQDHAKIWEGLLDTLEKALQDRELELLITAQLRAAAKEYAEGFGKKVAVWVMEMTGALDYETATRTILDKALTAIRGARDDPDNYLRRKLDKGLLNYANRLAEGERTATQSVEYIWERMVANAELQGIVKQFLTWMAEMITTHIANEGMPLLKMIRQFIMRQLAMLRADPARQEQLNRWVKQKIMALAAERRHWISEAVRKNLALLPDDQWRLQIEDKVSDDLQWIRVNGAVVGSLVGLALATIKCLLDIPQ